MLEKRLESFLKDEEVSAEVMFDLCRRMHAVDPTALMCLDFLVTEYGDFIDMMLDYQRIMNYNLAQENQTE